MLLIGSRHRRNSCSEAYRFARSGCVSVDPKIDLDVSGLLSWGSSIAPPSTQPSCVVTRLGRRPDFGPGLPRPDRVPLLPFLPAPAVCYAASRSEDPLVRRSAGLLHPAADHGVRHVSDSLTRPRSRASDPKVVDPKVHPGIVPCGEDPSKRSPPRQPSTMPSPRLVLSDAVAFTGWRSLSPLERRSLACHHAALCCSRPQGFLPPRSPLRSCDVAVARPLDAPLGFGSTRSRRCRACRAAQLSLDVSPGGPNRFGVPSPEREGKAGCFGPVWLHATDVRLSPKGPPWSIAVAPAVPEGAASAASPTGHEGDASESAPRGGPPRRSVHPKASGFRRHRDASPKRLVRDPALAPKSGGRWFELLPSVLPRLPAYMMERPLAADTHTRRREHLRATRAHPRRMLRRTPLPNPEGLERRASRRRHPEVGPWRLVTPAISSKLENAGSGPDSRRVHRDSRDSIRRRSLSPDPKIGMTGAEAPWVRSVRTSHLWWRSVASTEVPAPRWTVIHPGSPDRSRRCFRSEVAEAIPKPRPV
jgi:hypothetical protein